MDYFPRTRFDEWSNRTHCMYDEYMTIVAKLRYNGFFYFASSFISISVSSYLSVCFISRAQLNTQEIHWSQCRPLPIQLLLECLFLGKITCVLCNNNRTIAQLDLRPSIRRKEEEKKHWSVWVHSVYMHIVFLSICWFFFALRFAK